MFFTDIVHVKMTSGADHLSTVRRTWTRFCGAWLLIHQEVLE